MMIRRSFRLSVCVGVFVALYSFAFIGQTLAFNDASNVSTLVEVERNNTGEDFFSKQADKTKSPWRSREKGTARYLPLARHDSPARISKEDSSFDYSKLNDFLSVATWVATGCLVIVALYFLSRALYVVWFNSRNKALDSEFQARERRIQTLATEAVDRYDDLYLAAEDALSRGDLRYALIYYFCWTLVELDKRGLIFLDKGKTNLEYWRELEGREDCRLPYRRLMRSFERVYFGGESITRDEFARVWALRDVFSKVENSETVVRAPHLPVLLFLALGLFSCFFGCRRDENSRWRNYYSDDVSVNVSDNMNAVSTYMDYCKTARKWKIRRVTSGRVKKNSGATAIFWFDGLYGSQGISSWSLVDPSVDESRVGECEEAWTRCLRRYAESTEKDSIMLTTGAPVESFAKRQDAIVGWLKQKPGRVFVYVVSDWNAYRSYLLDARKALLDQCGSPLELDECEMLLRANVFAEQTFYNKLEDELNCRRQMARKLLSISDVFQKYRSPDVDGDTGDLPSSFESSRDHVVGADVFFSPRDFRINSGVSSCEFWSDDAKDYAYRARYYAERSDLPFLSRFRVKPDYLKKGERNAELNDFSGFNDFDSLRASYSFSGVSSWVGTLPKDCSALIDYHIEPLGETTTLVALGGEPLICERRYGQSRLLLVSSSAFLTNYGLFDPTCQALASRLSEEIPQKSRVVFAIGSFHGFESEDEIHDRASHGSFSLVRLTPYTAFIWHAFALCAFVFFCAFPIFGRAKRLRKESVNDFGRHLDAIASELRRSGAREWTQDQLNAFRESDKHPEH